MPESKMQANAGGEVHPTPSRALVIVFSYHHHNTGKVARAIADVLDAPVTTPAEISPEEVAGYDLVGFGSGIYSAQNHPSLIRLAGSLPNILGKKAFVFSTYGAPEALYPGARLQEFVRQNHAALKKVLESRGYTVVGEFACAGWNTNSFLKYFGGLNKGRPNADDLYRAQEFARDMKRMCR